MLSSSGFRDDRLRKRSGRAREMEQRDPVSPLLTFMRVSPFLALDHTARPSLETLMPHVYTFVTAGGRPA